MHTITEMVLCSEAGTPALSPLRGGFQQLTHNVNGKPVKWACSVHSSGAGAHDTWFSLRDH